MTTPATLADLIPTAATEVVTPEGATGLPTAEDAKQLTRQYKKALQGLYETYKFGQMLLQVKEALERDATRGTALKKAPGHGWNAGTGLKNWLAEHCPEVNYSTARRFLSVAERTAEALPEEARGDEAAVRDYLEGKSQREVLATPKAEAPRRGRLSPEEAAQAEFDVFSGFLTRLEQHLRTQASRLLTAEHRREVVIRLKTLAKDLESEARG